MSGDKRAGLLTQAKDAIVHYGTKLVERGVVLAVGFAHVQLTATEADRETFREMARVLGRRLTLTEKHMVITMRLGAEAGAAAHRAHRAARQTPEDKP